MIFKDVYDLVKKHPAMVATALFLCLIIGAFCAMMYIEISGQRTGLLDERIQKLEMNTRNQKKVNKIILSQINVLRHGYQNLPSSLKLLQSEFESVVALNILDDAKKNHVKGLIQTLSAEIDNVEIALEKSEVLTKTFEDFLSATLAEQQGKYELAINLYTRAADLGNAEAQYRLGTIYASGRGVPVDVIEASEWYQKAALAGNVDARAELAQLYYTGQGVEKDVVKALALYKSLENDAPLSVQAMISRLSNMLSQEQLRQADKLANMYLEAGYLDSE